MVSVLVTVLANLNFGFGIRPKPKNSGFGRILATPVLYSTSWMVGGQCYVHPK